MELDLISQLQSKTRQLELSIKQLRKSGTDYAEKERDYKILLRQECLKLRDDGMAIGMIQMTAYGIPKVAEARFQRDIAEAIYKANMEAINSPKTSVKADGCSNLKRMEYTDK